jgi:hypothetical protein
MFCLVCVEYPSYLAMPNMKKVPQKSRSLILEPTDCTEEALLHDNRQSRDIAQAVSRLLPTSAAQVRSHVVWNLWAK